MGKNPYGGGISGLMGEVDNLGHNSKGGGRRYTKQKKGRIGASNSESVEVSVEYPLFFVSGRSQQLTEVPHSGTEK